VAPRSVDRGAREAGSGSGGDAGPPMHNEGRPHPATESHLPAEETAPSFAVVPDFTATRTGQRLCGRPALSGS